MTVESNTAWKNNIDNIIAEHTERLTKFERDHAVSNAVQEEQRKHLDSRLNRIQDNINNINVGINKVLWAIGLAVMLALVQFVLAGGLKLL